MKILFLHDEPWDSGIARYALSLADEIKTRGHDAEFWCRKNSFAAAEAKRLGLSTKELDQPWTRLLALRREIQKRGFDLINAHTGSAQALALFIKGSVPLIRSRADARKPRPGFLTRFALKRTRLVVAANAEIAFHLKAFFPGTRVELVFAGIAGAPKEIVAAKDGAVGILGRLDCVKGHEHFLAAAAILKLKYPRLKFLIAGQESRPGRTRELKDKAAALGLNSSVEFLGHVENIWDFIARCKIGVVASTSSEAVSRAALEWMSAGRAVVLSRTGCLPDLISDGTEGFLVNPGDPEGLARALQKALDAPEKAAEMGRRARERFEGFFSLKRFADESLRVFSEAIR